MGRKDIIERMSFPSIHIGQFGMLNLQQENNSKDDMELLPLTVIKTKPKTPLIHHGKIKEKLEQGYHAR